MTVAALLPDLQALFQQAAARHGAGDLVTAQALYRRVLERAPEDAEVLGWLGAAECASGAFEAGLVTLDRAVAGDPAQPMVHYNRGNALQYLDRFDEALVAFDRAVALAPGYADAWGSRGTALHRLDRLDEAIASHDRAIALRPDFALAHSNRASALWRSGRLRAALDGYNRALALQPDFVPARVARGSVFQELGYPEEAIADFDRAIAVQPDHADAHANRANARLNLHRNAAALADYDKAFALNPGLFSVAGQALHVRMLQCDWEDFEARLKTVLELQEAGGCPVLPFALHSLADAPEAQRAAAEAFMASRFPAGTLLPKLTPHPRHDRIRVAYFSSDFTHHPVSQLIAGVLERHDRSRFEIYAVSLLSHPDDAWRRRIRDGVEHFVDVSDRSDPQVTAWAREREIDVAVDLTGITQGNRTRIFAERAAPVQASYLGFLGTMGADYYDYLIADRVIVPEEARGAYREKIVYLPSFQANDAWAPVVGEAERRALGLPRDGFVFCSFNQTYKLTPHVFAGWMRILERVPGSVLWLYANQPAAVDNLRAEAGRRGIDAGRLIFAPAVDLDAHLARMRAADLFLDSHPYNAGATASNALRAGLPVVTRLGRAFAARMGASLLTSAELPDLIATTPEAYEDLAVELATRPERLAEVRRRLAAALPTCRLFDAAAATRSLETAFVAMDARARQGLAPEHIHV